MSLTKKKANRGDFPLQGESPPSAFSWSPSRADSESQGRLCSLPLGCPTSPMPHVHIPQLCPVGIGPGATSAQGPTPYLGRARPTPPPSSHSTSELAWA